MKYWVIAICIAVTLSSNVWASRQQAVLRFVTEASYPPFESYNNKQELVGFDIALVKALCDLMEQHCEIYHRPFDSLIASVAHGHYDAAISALDISNERLKVVDFTQSYFSNDAVFIAHQATSLDQLYPDVVVGVQAGSQLQTHLQQHRGDVLAIPYASYQSALNDLAQLRIDAVFIDYSAALAWLAEHSMFQASVESNYQSEGFGIAVAKNNQNLLDSLNIALEQLQKNGSLAELKQQYFGQNDN